MANSVPTIAVTSTLAMVRMAEARGVAVEVVLRAVGVERDTLEAPDARLPATTVLAVWGVLRERTGDPSLQLHAPSMLPFGAYQVLDYLVASSQTLGDGVQQFARFFGLIAEAVSLTIERRADGYALCLLMANGAPVTPVYADYIFAALVSRLRMRIRPTVQVQRLELRHAAPPDDASYREVFGVPVRFGAPADRLSFSHEEWQAPTATPDVALARLLEEHARILAGRAPRATAGIVAEVERAMTARPADSGSATAIARSLNVSVRTLQRRLVDAGTNFRDVSDGVRWQLAEGYLTNPRVSIAEVACLLGFSEQSSFNRAFQRWTGESPGRWRQRAGGSERRRLR